MSSFFSRLKSFFGFSSYKNLYKKIDEILKKDVNKLYLGLEDVVTDLAQKLNLMKCFKKEYSLSKLKKIVNKRINYWANLINEISNVKDFELSILCICLIGKETFIDKKIISNTKNFKNTKKKILNSENLDIHPTLVGLKFLKDRKLIGEENFNKVFNFYINFRKSEAEKDIAKEFINRFNPVLRSTTSESTKSEIFYTSFKIDEKSKTVTVFGTIDEDSIEEFKKLENLENYNLIFTKDSVIENIKDLFNSGSFENVTFHSGANILAEKMFCKSKIKNLFIRNGVKTKYSLIFIDAEIVNFTNYQLKENSIYSAKHLKTLYVPPTKIEEYRKKNMLYLAEVKPISQVPVGCSDLDFERDFEFEKTSMEKLQKFKNSFDNFLKDVESNIFDYRLCVHNGLASLDSNSNVTSYHLLTDGSAEIRINDKIVKMMLETYKSDSLNFKKIKKKIKESYGGFLKEFDFLKRACEGSGFTRYNIKDLRRKLKSDFYEEYQNYFNYYLSLYKELEKEVFFSSTKAQFEGIEKTFENANKVFEEFNRLEIIDKEIKKFNENIENINKEMTSILKIKYYEDKEKAKKEFIKNQRDKISCRNKIPFIENENLRKLQYDVLKTVASGLEGTTIETDLNNLKDFLNESKMSLKQFIEKIEYYAIALKIVYPFNKAKIFGYSISNDSVEIEITSTYVLELLKMDTFFLKNIKGVYNCLTRRKDEIFCKNSKFKEIDKIDKEKFFEKFKELMLSLEVSNNRLIDEIEIFRAENIKKITQMLNQILSEKNKDNLDIIVKPAVVELNKIKDINSQILVKMRNETVEIFEKVLLKVDYNYDGEKNEKTACKIDENNKIITISGNLTKFDAYGQNRINANEIKKISDMDLEDYSLIFKNNAVFENNAVLKSLSVFIDRDNLKEIIFENGSKISCSAFSDSQIKKVLIKSGAEVVGPVFSNSIIDDVVIENGANIVEFGKDVVFKYAKIGNITNYQRKEIKLYIKSDTIIKKSILVPANKLEDYKKAYPEFAGKIKPTDCVKNQVKIDSDLKFEENIKNEICKFADFFEKFIKETKEKIEVNGFQSFIEKISSSMKVFGFTLANNRLKIEIHNNELKNKLDCCDKMFSDFLKIKKDIDEKYKTSILKLLKLKFDTFDIKSIKKLSNYLEENLFIKYEKYYEYYKALDKNVPKNKEINNGITSIKENLKNANKILQDLKEVENKNAIEVVELLKDSEHIETYYENFNKNSLIFKSENIKNIEDILNKALENKDKYTSNYDSEDYEDDIVRTIKEAQKKFVKVKNVKDLVFEKRKKEIVNIFRQVFKEINYVYNSGSGRVEKMPCYIDEYNKVIVINEKFNTYKNGYYDILQLDGKLEGYKLIFESSADVSDESEKKLFQKEKLESVVVKSGAKLNPSMFEGTSVSDFTSYRFTDLSIYGAKILKNIYVPNNLIREYKKRYPKFKDKIKPIINGEQNLSDIRDLKFEEKFKKDIDNFNIDFKKLLKTMDFETTNYGNLNFLRNSESVTSYQIENDSIKIKINNEDLYNALRNFGYSDFNLQLIIKTIDKQCEKFIKKYELSVSHFSFCLQDMFQSREKLRSEISNIFHKKYHVYCEHCKSFDKTFREDQLIKEKIEKIEKNLQKMDKIFEKLKEFSSFNLSKEDRDTSIKPLFPDNVEYYLNNILQAHKSSQIPDQDSALNKGNALYVEIEKISNNLLKQYKEEILDIFSKILEIFYTKNHFVLSEENFKKLLSEEIKRKVETYCNILNFDTTKYSVSFVVSEKNNSVSFEVKDEATKFVDLIEDSNLDYKDMENLFENYVLLKEGSKFLKKSYKKYFEYFDKFKNNVEVKKKVEDIYEFFHKNLFFEKLNKLKSFDRAKIEEFDKEKSLFNKDNIGKIITTLNNFLISNKDFKENQNDDSIKNLSESKNLVLAKQTEIKNTKSSVLQELKTKILDCFEEILKMEVKPKKS